MFLELRLEWKVLVKNFPLNFFLLPALHKILPAPPFNFMDDHA